MKKKKCTKCKKIKDINDFSKRAASKDGLRHQCKKCIKIYRAKYYVKNSEKEKIWRKENSENIKIYYIKNKDKIKTRAKKRYYENREYAITRSRKRYQENKESINKKQYQYKKNKLSTDPIFKVLNSIRKRQTDFFSGLKNKIIKKQEIKKTASFHEFLGCDKQRFIEHMESQFTPEMSWNNHGILWHVDHIKPLILFDMSNIDEQHKACHYTNLQPLTVADNLKKGAKYFD